MDSDHLEKTIASVIEFSGIGLHSGAPVLAFSANTLPSVVPTYTTPFTMVGEDNTDSPGNGN